MQFSQTIGVAGEWTFCAAERRASVPSACSDAASSEKLTGVAPGANLVCDDGVASTGNVRKCAPKRPCVNPASSKMLTTPQNDLHRAEPRAADLLNGTLSNKRAPVDSREQPRIQRALKFADRTSH